MDRSEDNMDLFGIFKQSFKTIHTWKKIFTQITLTLVLPLTIIFIVQTEIAHHLFWKIEYRSLPYDINYEFEPILSEWLYYLLLKFVYLILLSIFSLLTTSVVVFTIASIYTGKEVVFHNVMKVVPNVWKRLFVTFAFIYILLFAYNVIGRALVFISKTTSGYSIHGLVLLSIISIIFLLGFLYLTVICQLAIVVTILENMHAFKSIKKGTVLAKGKKQLGMGIAFVFYLFLVALIFVHFLIVEQELKVFKLALVLRVIIGMLCGLLLLMWFLLFIVTQAFLYLDCKSYHREAIDLLSLSTYLGAYTGEIAVYPKPGEEVQLGTPQSQSPSQHV